MRIIEMLKKVKARSVKSPFPYMMVDLLHFFLHFSDCDRLWIKLMQEADNYGHKVSSQILVLIAKRSPNCVLLMIIVTMENNL